MKQIILSLILFSVSLTCYSQELDSLLSIKKSKVEWLMGTLAENTVLKKRLIVKDTAILKLQARIKVHQDIIKSYKRDSVNNETQFKLQVTKSNLKDTRITSLETDYSRVKKERNLLGLGILGLTTLSTLLLIR